MQPRSQGGKKRDPGNEVDLHAGFYYNANERG